MRRWTKNTRLPLLGILGKGILFWWLQSSAIAQIIPDNTLPTNSSVTQGCTNCEITGGTQSGANLFHSFTQFSVPNQGTAYFNNAIDIQNIFARVTGEEQSTINGTIRANGSANLFLLNPRGIIFGPNASLDIGGSFLATTAESINFNGFQFSATHPQTVPLLTVSVPIGLQFGSNSASIINRSQASPGGRVNTLQRPTGLEVSANRSLSLLGSGVFLENGNLTARGGDIYLGSVAPGSGVSLVPRGTGYIPGRLNDQTLSDITLSNFSYIDTSGGAVRPRGGAVNLQGRTIILSNGARIYSRTYQDVGENLQLLASDSIMVTNGSLVLAIAENQGTAGNVILQAGQTLTLSGPNSFSAVGSQARDNAVFGARAGDIVINAGHVSVQDGSRIEASTFGAGEGGNIQIQAVSIEVTGYSHVLLDGNGDGIPGLGEVTSGIFSQTQGSGNAGSLTITTQRLTALEGGVISTATFTGGNGGTLTINALDSVVLRGASPAVERNFFRSGIFVSASDPAATGQVGALAIATNQLVIDDLADISARNEGAGASGAVTLRQVDRLVVRGGGEIRASTLGSGPGGSLTIEANSVELSGQGMIGTELIPSTLTALASDTSSGNAGDLTIRASNVRVQDGAEISVSAAGTGTAGNIAIGAETLRLDGGRLVAETQAGELSNANIQLQISDALLMLNQSRISAQAFNNATGGNVSIVAPEGFIVATPDENNDIVANAFQGRGGNIAIDARSIIGLEERSSLPLDNDTNDIDASSQFGLSGSVQIIQPIVDPSQGLVELPATAIDATQQIARRCGGAMQEGDRLGEFVITGRGGLPSTPDNIPGVSALTPTLTSLEVQAPSIAASVPASLADGPTTLIEAQGWTMGSHGQVVLIASAEAVTMSSPLSPVHCSSGH